MKDDTERLLYDLFVGIFRSEAELERFLVIQSYPVERLVPVTKGSTLSFGARAVAHGLVERGLVDDRLFEALRTRAPGRVRDIDRVARSLAEKPPQPTIDDIEPLRYGLDPGRARSAADTLFLASLEASLAELTDPDPVAPALEPQCWPWTGAVAVLGAFRPAPLSPNSAYAPPEAAIRPLTGPNPTDPAPAALAGFVRTVTDGRWVLRDEVRIPALRKLRDEHSLADALSVNADLPDARRDALALLTSGGSASLSSLDLDQLNDLDVVLGWLEQIDAAPPLQRADVHAAAERRRLIDPLRQLVGKHFRGREQELSDLRRHIRTDGDPDPVIRLHGLGGVGKSSLIGWLLLDLEKEFGVRPRPFAYLDFDRALHDSGDPRGLVEQIARQLRLLYVNSTDAVNFAALEGISAGTDFAAAAQLLDIAPDLDLVQLIAVLASRLGELWQVRASPDDAPLVLVLDTFEEVQAKGPGAVRDVLSLVENVLLALEGTRVIIAGRSLKGMSGPGRLVVLGDLDRTDADAVLEQRGVKDPGIRSLIIDRFGSNPLTLRLAAEALSRLGTAAEAFDGVVAQADALAEVAMQQIQGMLYSRILGHLNDADVVRVAHPGLAVRLVTVEVLREVLAVPCEFDPARAEDMFDRLRRQVSMFELLADGTLQHRQDVRQLMLRMMGQDPRLAPKVADIHRRAAAFYGKRDGAAARAEELYHRLMSGEDPRSLAQLWRRAEPAGRPPSPDEPLPKRALLWLERRLGLAPEADRDEWVQEDWEDDAAVRAASWLASGNPTEALAVLQERELRVVGSRLPALDVAAATAVGDLSGAVRILDHAMAAAIHDRDLAAQLDLVEQAVILRARLGDAAGVGEAARAAASIADLTGERVRAVDILVRAVVALQDAGHSSEASVLGQELARRFRALDGTALRGAPELVREVLHAIGTYEPGVLLYAAQHAGDRVDVFVPDAYAIARLLGDTSPAAGNEMQTLASAVGTAARPGDQLDLASRAVRLGRIGQAIQIGVDHAVDADAAGALVTNELVIPPREESSRGIPLPGRNFA